MKHPMGPLGGQQESRKNVDCFRLIQVKEHRRSETKKPKKLYLYCNTHRERFNLYRELVGTIR